MRFVLVVVALSGCFAGSLDSNLRPAVIPKLSALPGDTEKRDGVLDQSAERASREQRRGMTKRERKVETIAAVAAALIGEAFSSSKNVTMGVAGDFDENQMFEKTPQPRKPAAKDATEKEKPSADLVPWIRLDQKSKPADIESVRCCFAVSVESHASVSELGRQTSEVPTRSSTELPARANCASTVNWNT